MPNSPLDRPSGDPLTRITLLAPGRNSQRGFPKSAVRERPAGNEKCQGQPAIPADQPRHITRFRKQQGGWNPMAERSLDRELHPHGSGPATSGHRFERSHGENADDGEDHQENKEQNLGDIRSPAARSVKPNRPAIPASTKKINAHLSRDIDHPSRFQTRRENAPRCLTPLESSRLAVSSSQPDMALPIGKSSAGSTRRARRLHLRIRPGEREGYEMSSASLLYRIARGSTRGCASTSEELISTAARRYSPKGSITSPIAASRARAQPRGDNIARSPRHRNGRIPTAALS